MACQSNDTGRYEIDVRPFVGQGGTFPISTAGGMYPRWSRDGRELYYISPDAKMMAVPVRATAAAIEALYARGADVFAGLRVKVIEAPDEGAGARLELFDIRLDSFLERLGIENNDVLVAINDEPVDSIDAVVKALDAARDKQSFTADFTRDGEPFRLSLRALRVEP